MPGSSRRGSAQVEAALIIPLVILIIVGMVKLGIALYGEVLSSSAENAEAAASLATGGTIPTESILRLRWHIL